jgi:hypothetical protein
MVEEALAIGCPDGYCGRVNYCGICHLAKELGLFEELRGVKPEGYPQEDDPIG